MPSRSRSACGISLAGLCSYVGKALEALREAVGRGLRNAALLQQTPEFASLKDDAEFKKILAGLAATR